MRVGPAVLLTPDDAGLLAVAGDAIRGYWRRNGLEPPRLEAVLTELLACARAGRDTAGTAAGTAANLPSVALATAEPVEWLSTEQAASRLRTKPRNVRDLAQRGRLVGARQRRAHGPWEIPATACERYLQHRSGRGGVDVLAS